MKLGFDTTSILGNSGIETYGRELLKALIQLYQEHEFHLITNKNKKGKIASIFGNTPNIIYHNCMPHELMLGEALSPITRVIKNLIWKRKEKYIDLFHFTYFFRLPKIRNYAVTLHDLFLLDYPEKKLERKFKKSINYILKNAALIFVPSYYVAQDLTRFHPDSKDKIIVTYEGVSGNYKKIPKEHIKLSEYGIQPDETFFLYVGRIDPRKNLSGLIEAYSLLPEEVRREHRLVLVANGKGLLMEELKSKIIENGIKGNTILLQSIPENKLIELYSAAFCFVFPTHGEGFGLPVLEAMKCGCPVITSNNTSLPEVAGNAAILINPEDINEIKNAMLKIISDNELRERLIEEGFRNASLFSWEEAARRTMKGYQTIFNNKL
ncbi:MAG: glycosyl transferase group 1 [Ignavibacteria bacterium]|nr:glycosyl transferase group 1 [Ignavibacteria bacterium]